MRWRVRRRRSDVVDRRGEGYGAGGSFPVPARIGAGLGVPGVIVLIIILLLSRGGGGFDVDAPPGGLGAGQPPAGGGLQHQDDRLVKFVEFVVGDVQDFWHGTFQHSDRPYERAHLILFEGATRSACGGATSDIGPHYCPADQNVYLDLGFFRELKSRFGAPGDFAEAYVIAHEIGHHVQNLLGIDRQMRREQQANPDETNELSVRLELEADCFAGVWAFTTYKRDLLESGDLEEGLDAAAAVGDDRIQRQAGQRVNPETWTHGSAEQRVTWFKNGFADGDPNDCDTFAVSDV